MAFRDRVMGWLDRGEVSEPHPDTPVEIDDVRIFEGPMLLAALEEAGIMAHGVDAPNYNLPEDGTRLRMRILVRYADAARASEVLADFRRGR
jgi:hypothetical protein